MTISRPSVVLCYQIFNQAAKLAKKGKLPGQPPKMHCCAASKTHALLECIRFSVSSSSCGDGQHIR